MKAVILAILTWAVVVALGIWGYQVFLNIPDEIWDNFLVGVPIGLVAYMAAAGVYYLVDDNL